MDSKISNDPELHSLADIDEETLAGSIAVLDITPKDPEDVLARCNILLDELKRFADYCDQRKYLTEYRRKVEFSHFKGDIVKEIEQMQKVGFSESLVRLSLQPSDQNTESPSWSCSPAGHGFKFDILGSSLEYGETTEMYPAFAQTRFSYRHRVGCRGHLDKGLYNHRTTTSHGNGKEWMEPGRF